MQFKESTTTICQLALKLSEKITSKFVSVLFLAFSFAFHMQAGTGNANKRAAAHWAYE